MSVAGWTVAGDEIRIPQAADVTIGLAVTESIDGAAATPVNLNGFAEIRLTAQRSRDTVLLTLSTLDAPARLTVVNGPAGTLSGRFTATDFPDPVGVEYRLDLLADGETAGKPYGTGTLTVYAT